MRIKINRPQLLTRLEMCEPGLSIKGIIQQSSSFIFQKGKIFTFNEDVSCQITSGLPKEFKAAIASKKLLEHLRAADHDEMLLSIENGEAVFRATNEEFGIAMESEIQLQLDMVESPKSWSPIPTEFSEALAIITECASKDESKSILCCLHLHPEYMEASDDYQFCKYRISTGLKRSALVKSKCVKQLSPLGMLEMGLSPKWLHFKNSVGLIYSVLRFDDQFPATIGAYKEAKADANNMVIPRGLTKAIEEAQISSSEDADDDSIMLELKPGAVRITGRGATSWKKKRLKLKYNGPPIQFMISPKLLAKISAKHNQCQINKQWIRVNGGPWTFISCLGSPNQPGESNAKINEESSDNMD